MKVATIIKNANKKTDKFKKIDYKEKNVKKFSPNAFGILKDSFGMKKSVDVVFKIRKKWR